MAVTLAFLKGVLGCLLNEKNPKEDVLGKCKGHLELDIGTLCSKCTEEGKFFLSKEDLCPYHRTDLPSSSIGKYNELKEEENSACPTHECSGRLSIESHGSCKYENHLYCYCCKFSTLEPEKKIEKCKCSPPEPGFCRYEFLEFDNSVFIDYMDSFFPYRVSSKLPGELSSDDIAELCLCEPLDVENVLLLWVLAVLGWDPDEYISKLISILKVLIKYYDLMNNLREKSNAINKTCDSLKSTQEAYEKSEGMDPTIREALKAAVDKIEADLKVKEQEFKEIVRSSMTLDVCSDPAIVDQ